SISGESGSAYTTGSSPAARADSTDCSRVGLRRGAVVIPQTISMGLLPMVDCTAGKTREPDGISWRFWDGQGSLGTGRWGMRRLVNAVLIVAVGVLGAAT